MAQEFAKLLRKLNINGRRNFYALRHTFQTIGGEAKDPEAVSRIMGHADQSMAAHYRERISDERLLAVVDVVRAWLWPVEETDEGSVVNAEQLRLFKTPSGILARNDRLSRL